MTSLMTQRFVSKDEMNTLTLSRNFNLFSSGKETIRESISHKNPMYLKVGPKSWPFSGCQGIFKGFMVSRAEVRS